MNIIFFIMYNLIEIATETISTMFCTAAIGVKADQKLEKIR